VSAPRPRDSLGRPLADGADPALAVSGIESIAGLDDAQVWALAVEHLEDGRPFHAHEVFEERWRTAPADERDAWRALAQWGAALTHAARGNSVGARRLARRTLETLDSADRIPPCVDLALVRDSCDRLTD
jgi:uncharacterized protein